MGSRLDAEKEAKDDAFKELNRRCDYL